MGVADFVLVGVPSVHNVSISDDFCFQFGPGVSSLSLLNPRLLAGIPAGLRNNSVNLALLRALTKEFSTIQKV